MTLPTSKRLIGLAQTSLTAAATGTAQFDTLGFAYALIDVLMATANVVSNNPSVLKMSQSDTTDATNYSDITALVGDGVGGFTIPDHVTTGNNTHRFGVDLRGKKRYLKCSVSPLTTQVTTITADLFRGAKAPISAAEVGVLSIANG
jgi:hypothetical protein